MIHSRKHAKGHFSNPQFPPVVPHDIIDPSLPLSSVMVSVSRPGWPSSPDGEGNDGAVPLHYCASLVWRCNLISVQCYCTFPISL